MDLLRDPIPGLIRQLAIPASVGFFFNTMYNIVDTYYAGLISTEALAALSLSFPVFFIMIAVGAGISQGTTALIANALGASDEDQAHRLWIQALTFGILLGLVLTVAGLFLSRPLFHLLGAEGAYLETSLRYMQTIMAGTILFLMQSITNTALGARGDTRTFRNVLIGGFLLNLALDPWFLFGGFGLPPMGIRGIALATVVIQGLGSTFLFTRVRRLPGWQGISLRRMIPERKPFQEIATQGFPAAVNMSTVALGIFVITWFVSRFSKEGVAAYGIATRIEQMVLLPTIGLNIAVLTLTGQNNGAGLLHRVRETWITTIRYGIFMMLAGGAAIFVLRESIMSIFTDDSRVIANGSDYLAIASITLAAYVILFQTVFMLQGLKRPMYAVWIGIYRQIVAPLLVFQVLAFGLDWKLHGIWWGIFFVTWSAALVTLAYGLHILKHLKPA